MEQRGAQPVTQDKLNLTGSQSGWRQFKDKFVGYGVTFGGTMVLVALLLIFFYLLYVVKPVFDSAQVSQGISISYNDNVQTVYIGSDEQNEIAYRFTSEGKLNFYDLVGKQGVPGALIQSDSIAQGGKVVATAHAMTHQETFAAATDDGYVYLVKPKFSVSYPNDVRTITPKLDFDLAPEGIEISEEGGDIAKLTFGYDDDAMTFAFVDQAGDLQLTKVEGEVNFITEEVEWSSSFAEVSEAPKGIVKMLVTPNQAELFILDDQRQVYLFDIEDADDVRLKQVLEVAEGKAGISDITLLAGASSLLVSSDNGLISQWFEVKDERGRSYQRIRDFDAGFAVKQLSTEFFRKSFAAIGENGEQAIFYTTSHREVLNIKFELNQVTKAGFNVRANSLMLDTTNGATFFIVDNPHPEISWSGLWQKVWYEGYPEAQYIWQSTSATEDFEAKLSLTPLVFGTMKAAFYAMLFAVPIAIAGAVYTAYFMSPKIRGFVKPTVELMEALPTVILGFLAGLWLAPLVEENLPGLVMTIVLLPVTMIVTAFAYHKMPKSWKVYISEDYRELILLPILLFVGWAAFAMSPMVEMWLFDGDSRAYITNELGITFDQRNALVVGVAMGFAVIPTIFSIAEDAVFSVPKHLSNGSLALGATQWQTLTRVVLLTASPGIFSAVMMGLGRAVGETMIVLMATGNTPIMEWSFFEGMRTLAANIAVEMPESAIGSTHYRVLFLAAFVLFIFTFCFNTIAEFVRQRLRERYSSL
ncbi:ABC transporter permease subunit [Paraferrimonas sp. SM1919]|uniref:ABC transporter permease subunit n=1 Tax=Paraferrimonas sp. SM1919 TaxID=2662263 RepID=UPI0013D4A2E3|nr:ABC transporter permease subunit [Paraferrimonas sp. SM1919]